ncbi:hypothetical protein HN51_021022 [Arachis hypogaea]|uniref:Pentacotripeptide-repeat region of PRORP domain-containing protein n=2 Tax=Arachis hypogaea TaxID=3818 RepID=A0A445EI89_ARAHY|nr:pentatricopeptide repeat-containing protein At3g61520, mitochondrial-like [Arachis hypogaea]QHO51933.1 Pentatricopeptide repeat-containing protein [Arachis hypogaea]RYR75179.1 hypothetical protein Ahy_A02g009855 isoform B [Arachis hypogaea]
MMLLRSFKLLRRRRRSNLPPFPFSSPRRHSTAVDVSNSKDVVSSSIVTQLQELLQHPKDEWDSHESKNLLLPLLFNDSEPLSSRQILQITRQLGSTTKALDFLEFIRTNAEPEQQHCHLLSSVFQSALELANRDATSKIEVLKLHGYLKSQNWKIDLSSQSALILLRCLEGAKMVDDSLFLFKRLDNSAKNSGICNGLLRLLMKSGRIDDALQVLDEMLERDSKILLNGSTGDIVFEELVKWRDPRGRSFSDEETLGLVKKLGEHGVFPDTFKLTQLITNLCKRKNNNAAREILHCVMEFGGEVDAAPCNAMLTGLGKGRDIEGMNKLLAKMQEMNIRPSVVTFGIVFRHLCAARRVDEALEMFNKLRGKGESNLFGVEPDAVLFNTLIDGLCKVEREEEALSLLEEMKIGSKHKPNTITYNCLIDGFGKAGNIDKAHELFDQMNEEGVQPNVVTLNVLVNGMCRSGRVHSAVEFFNAMKGKGLKGNAATYTPLISAFCGVNNIDKAMQFFDEMLSSGCSPDAIVYYSLISGLSIAGRMDDASIVVSKLKQAGFCLDVACYNVLISGFCKKNKLERVYEMLEEMENVGVKPDTVTYNTLLSSLGKSGDFETANKLMKKMRKEGLVPSVVTFGALIHANCLNDNVDYAMTIFQEMCSTTSKVPPNTVIYNILIDALCKKDDVEKAVSLMDDMEERGVTPNTTTYNAILKGIRDKRVLNVALALMDRMIANACSPDYVTMEILTEWLSAVGEIGKLDRFVKGYSVSSDSRPSLAKLFAASTSSPKAPCKSSDGKESSTESMEKLSTTSMAKLFTVSTDRPPREPSKLADRKTSSRRSSLAKTSAASTSSQRAPCKSSDSKASPTTSMAKLFTVSTDLPPRAPSKLADRKTSSRRSSSAKISAASTSSQRAPCKSSDGKASLTTSLAELFTVSTYHPLREPPESPDRKRKSS